MRARRSRWVAFQRSSSSSAGTRDVGGLDRAHGAALVHHRVLLGVADHRVGDPALPAGVEQAGHVVPSAARTASSKPSGRSLSPAGGGVLDHHLGLQPVDERAHEPGLDGGDERDPVGGEAGREHGDLEDERRPATEDRGRPAHHLTVGEDLGASDLDLAGRVGVLAGVGERPHDVVDRDRLRARVDPARRHHQRQPLDEVAQHLERGAARPDHHRGAHVDELGHALGQQLRDLVARAQVERGVGPGRPEAAQVDDALDAGGARRLAEVDRGRAVALGEVVARVRAAAHRVDQVVGGAHALERLGEPVALDGVALVQAHVARQVGAAGVADERAHAAPAAAQLVEEVGADVAGGAGQQDRFWVSCRGGHRARYGRRGRGGFDLRCAGPRNGEECEDQR